MREKLKYPDGYFLYLNWIFEDEYPEYTFISGTASLRIS